MNIEQRIRKLLTLSERGGTEAEAQAAMAMAHKLLAQYNIDMATIQAGVEEEPEGIITDEQTESKLSNTQPVDMIYGAIARLYFCRIYLSTRHHPTEGKRRNICIIGRPTNVAVVKYVAAYVVRSLEQVAHDRGKAEAQAMADEGVTLNLRRWRASFRVGYAVRIYERVEKEMREAAAGDTKSSDGRALVIAPIYERERQAITLYMRDQKIKLSASRNRGSAVKSMSAYEAGRKAAETANLRNNGLSGTEIKRIA